MCRDLLREQLFDKLDTVVLTSATLAVARQFRLRAEAAGARSMRARWLCPAISIIRSRRCSTCRSICPTRAVPAFSARRGRRDYAHPEAQPRPGVRAVHQLSADAAGLRPRLARDRISRRCCRAPGRAARCSKNSARRRNCVLFATSSFWQGVDVPGEQLSCVIIDKLPFAVPNDPVVEARIGTIREDGRQSVLRLPDSAGRHRAETGVRAADPQQVGPRRAGAAG